jgi:hypothetical protein
VEDGEKFNNAAFRDAQCPQCLAGSSQLKFYRELPTIHAFFIPLWTLKGAKEAPVLLECTQCKFFGPLATRAPVAPHLGDHKYGNSNTSIRACVRCGTPAVDEDDLFCRRCGENMPPASAPAA